MKFLNEKYDLKLIVITIIIFVIALLFFSFWLNIKHVIRYVLEAKLTYYLTWVITTLIFILNYLKHKSKMFLSETIITKQFGYFVDNALGGITYGTAITTSLTFLKGLFIQYFFKDVIFFTEFDNFDLITVFALMIFLLYFSVMKIIEIVKETYIIQHTEQVLTENKTFVKNNQEDNDTSLDDLNF